MRNWDIANVFLIPSLVSSSQRNKDLLLSRDTVVHETSGVTEQSTDLNPNRKESFYGKLYHHSVLWSESCSLNSSELIHSVTSSWLLIFVLITKVISCFYWKIFSDNFKPLLHLLVSSAMLCSCEDLLSWLSLFSVNITTCNTGTQCILCICNREF